MACRLEIRQGCSSTLESHTPFGSSSWTTVKAKVKPPKPRFISRDAALKMQKEMDIRGLCNTLLSEESRNLQSSGWRFVCVIKNDEESKNARSCSATLAIGEERTTIRIMDNKWGDEALFVRTSSPACIEAEKQYQADAISQPTC